MAKPNTNYLLIAKGLLRYFKGIAIARIIYKLILELRDKYIV
jgi:O-methyltransferase involved in polyketide biosynthesis